MLTNYRCVVRNLGLLLIETLLVMAGGKTSTKTWHGLSLIKSSMTNGAIDNDIMNIFVVSSFTPYRERLQITSLITVAF